MSSLIERYVYAVVKELPEGQREDIKKELFSLIEDMVDERGEGTEEEVLLELGNPKELAEQYRGKKRYLIGPKFFDPYISILKIVLISVWIGLFCVMAIKVVVDYTTFVDSLVEFITSSIQISFNVFTWVTVVFAILEYSGIEMDDLQKGKSWSLKDLPELPTADRISRGEMIFAIVFTTLFMILFVFFPQLPAAYMKNEIGGYDKVLVFNVEVLESLRLLIIAMFVTSIIQESLKLIVGKWTFKLAIVCSILSALSTLLSLFFFMNPKIWNADFFNVILPEDVNKIVNWDNVIYVICGSIIVVGMIEVISMLYKGYKELRKKS